MREQAHISNSFWRPRRPLRRAAHSVAAALLALFILCVLWAPMGVERRSGGTRTRLGFFPGVTVATNTHHLSLRGDETLVLGERAAVIVHPLAVIPVLLTGVGGCLCWRVYRRGAAA